MIKFIAFVSGEFIDENQIFQAIEKYKASIIQLPAQFLNSIAKSNYTRKYKLESLKVIVIFGSKIYRNIFLSVRQKFPGVSLFRVYGSTETGIISASSPKSGYLESIGFVLPNRQVKGPIMMMIGYYKDPVKTQEALDSDGWYHTGDLGYYHENGELFITDRISEMIKYKNHLISPGTIDSFLSLHPAVQESAVVSIPDEHDGELPVVFIKKVPGSNVTKEEISGILSTLKDLKRVRTRIYFLDKMPRIISTKISRLKLKQLAVELSVKKEI